jgi:branched-chain amino acid transport system substrate-binding protein
LTQSFKRFSAAVVVALAVSVTSAAWAQEEVKIGLVAEMSGPFSDFGKQMEAGIKIYLQQHGDTVAGKKVRIVIKDVGGPNPELAKRLAQDLIVQDKVNFLAGFGFTPNALSVAPIATRAKVPMVVMNAASTGLTGKSPFMVRTSFSYDAIVPPIAKWARKQGSQKAYVLVADYAPGHDAEEAFISAFEAAGGQIVGKVRTPIMTVDFAPYMQRIKDTKPDAVFTFVNAGNVAPAFMKEFRDKGLADAGVKLIGTGDIVFESAMDAIGDRGLGVVTSYPYSMNHASVLNDKFNRDFKAMQGANARPTIMAISAYDSMAAIYAALKKTGGQTDSNLLMSAFAGLSFESPRGLIAIHAKTRDIVQTNYIRRYERVGDGFANVEFESDKAAAQ